jgi:capsular polysaccharide transport system ATP-binding protein
MIILDELTCVLASGRLRTTILQDVSVVLPTDTHLVVLAQSGAGKSTLLRLFSGAVLPTAGTITRYARVSYPIGYTGGFKRSLTALENIAHAARVYGADVDEVVTFVAEVTEMGHALDEVYGDLPSQLSRRMAYAVSYAIPFDVYLIDDRVAAGDPEFRTRCEYMFEQRTKQSGFILTTSNSRYAKKYGKKAAILHDGAMVLYDDFEKALRDFDRLEKRKLSIQPRSMEIAGVDGMADGDDD